ncbi:hypothetical protein HYW55_00505 [Candidatus Gottesmanbacteria bacterium]|nr:hypothetical protein [Candidatus Gottesmanbacteria bacterium]
MNQDSSAHILLLTLLIVITINLFILDIKIFTPAATRFSDISTTIVPTAPVVSADANENSCPASCVGLIQNIQTSQTSAELPIQSQTSSQLPTTREYYIPLGSGSTQNTQWEDLTTTETLIDTALYGTVKEAYFIAALSNPTQNGIIEAQLYNATDKHAVWNSKVTMNGPSSQTISSGSITLDAGSKLYRVQLKSGLGFSASVTSAKIRIVTTQW